MRMVEQLLGPADRYELPAWLWEDRGLPVPATRADSGWTGPQAIVTTGGVLIYALPKPGAAGRQQLCDAGCRPCLGATWRPSART